jgi:hypothetical protein
MNSMATVIGKGTSQGFVIESPFSANHQARQGKERMIISDLAGR